MKAILILALCLLCPSLAGAACYKMTMAPFLYDFPQFYTGAGITTTFGEGWKVAGDADCGSCYNHAGVVGQFANEPSASYALYHTICDGFGVSVPLCTLGAHAITFDPPVKQIRFNYSGRFQIEHFAPPSYLVNVATLPITVHCYSGPIGSGRFMDPVGTADPNQSGHTYATYPHGVIAGMLASEGGPCSGDPTGEFCNWPEMLIQSPNQAITSIYIAIPDNGTFYTFDDAQNGLWIDDLEVCTEVQYGCPHPPCEFESAHQDRETPAARTSWGALKVIYR
jgi:hypothetical protein